MPPFYPIFACVVPDPYSEYGSGSRKAPKYGTNTDPDLQHCLHPPATPLILNPLMQATFPTKLLHSHLYVDC